jgi:hypothetical protein
VEIGAVMFGRQPDGSEVVPAPRHFTATFEPLG